MSEKTPDKQLLDDVKALREAGSTCDSAGHVDNPINAAQLMRVLAHFGQTTPCHAEAPEKKTGDVSAARFATSADPVRESSRLVTSPYVAASPAEDKTSHDSAETFNDPVYFQCRLGRCIHTDQQDCVEYLTSKVATAERRAREWRAKVEPFQAERDLAREEAHAYQSENAQMREISQRRGLELKSYQDSEARFRAAAEAAIAYDRAIAKRGSDGEIVELSGKGAIAEGHDLDALYFDWIAKTRAALSAKESVR